MIKLKKLVALKKSKKRDSGLSSVSKPSEVIMKKLKLLYSYINCKNGVLTNFA